MDPHGWYRSYRLKWENMGSKRDRVYAVILAGGRGERIGGAQKQFFLINRKPILRYSVEVFLESRSISDIIIVVPKQRVSSTTRLIRRWYKGGRVFVIAGGETRRLSSYAGLTFIREQLGGCGYVVFHDGVRPLVAGEMIESVLHEAKKHGAAVLGSQVLNVIANVREGWIVDSYHPKTMFNTQTPHCYRFDWILGAHEAEVNSGRDRTAYENIELVHAFGKKIRVVDRYYRNMKLTFPQDIIALSALLKRSKQKGFFNLPERKN
jgi:2-C-methyl-D-erythritol 4-phosphate cytidylyltransferase